jgi:uncharacterized membrane protein YecN with MAPEG domain
VTITVPVATAGYAAILGLLAIALTVRVILHRVKHRIGTGDGGNAQLARDIRAHANFTEQVPLALLLILLAEASGTPATVVHGLGVALVVARFASAWGLSHSLGTSKGREAGAGLTILVVAASSLLILYRLFSAA